MTGHHHEDASRPHYDDADLDELLGTAMDGILSKLEAGFDPHAGLADIYARCAAADPGSGHPAPVPQSREPELASASGRLQEVCDQIDTFDACLAAVIRSAQNDPFAGAAYVEAARPILMQLRIGLANRVLPRDEAAQLIDHIQRNLDETSRILSTQGSSLDEIIRARLGSDAQFGGPLMEQAQVMREMIMRLYEDVGYASLEPAL